MCARKVSANEIRERESELIAISRQLIEQDGISKLTIDKLVAACSYSKGTVYKHFSGKEDLLLAICNCCLQEKDHYFARAVAFEGNSREKALAIGLAYLIWARMHPQDLFVLMAASSPAVIECCSEHRLHDRSSSEGQLLCHFSTIMDQALENEELELPFSMKADQVAVALWTTAFGTITLVSAKEGSSEHFGMQLERDYFHHCHLVMDGMGWKPLYKNHDYKISLATIAKEIFSSELQQLADEGRPLNLDF